MILADARFFDSRTALNIGNDMCTEGGLAWITPEHLNQRTISASHYSSFQYSHNAQRIALL